MARIQVPPKPTPVLPSVQPGQPNRGPTPKLPGQPGSGQPTPGVKK